MGKTFKGSIILNLQLQNTLNEKYDISSMFLARAQNVMLKFVIIFSSSFNTSIFIFYLLFIRKMKEKNVHPSFSEVKVMSFNSLFLFHQSLRSKYNRFAYSDKDAVMKQLVNQYIAPSKENATTTNLTVDE